MASPVNIQAKLLESVTDCLDVHQQHSDLDLTSDSVQQQQHHQHQQNQVFADDPRALQLALELSMATLSDCNDMRATTAAVSTTATTISSSSSPTANHLHYYCNLAKQQQQQQHQQQQLEPKPSYTNQQSAHLIEYQQMQKQCEQQLKLHQTLRHHLQHQHNHNHDDDDDDVNDDDCNFIQTKSLGTVATTASTAAAQAAAAGVATTPSTEIPRLLSTFEMSLLSRATMGTYTDNYENKFHCNTKHIQLDNDVKATTAATTVSTPTTIGHHSEPAHALLADNMPLHASMLLSSDVTKPSLMTNNGILTTIDDRSKKSQNMTECVPVPSSEHVAEIVGRQGCKIKALRAKTNTYIKTPVRGDEPVFIITGRKEDVAKAQREILSAADHFSLIRATRRPSYDSGSSVLSGGIENNNTINNNNNHNSLNGCTNGDAETILNGITGYNSTITTSTSSCTSSSTTSGLPLKTGQITIQVRVPYRVVGLVVGTKGATIKHIQQETQTYIVTPSREKEPIFEVTGLPDNVQIARKKIEAHIALRTGNTSQAVGNNNANGTTIANPFDNVLTATNTADTTTNGITSVHSINTLSQFLNQTINLDFLTSIYKDNIVSTYMTSSTSSSSNDMYNNSNHNSNNLNSHDIAHHNDRLLMSSSLSSSSNALTNLKSETNNKFQTNCKLRIPAIASATDIAETKFHIKQAVAQSEMNIIDTANVHYDDMQQQQQQDINQFQSTTNTEKQTFSTETALKFKTIDTCLNSAFLKAGGSSGGGAAAVAAAASELSANDLTNISDNNLLTNHHYNRTATNMNTIFRSEVVNRMLSASGFTRSCSSASSTSSTKSVNNCDGSIGSSRPELVNIWRNITDSLEVDEGISESPNIWNLQTNQTPSLAATFTGSHCSPVTSISPTDSLLNEINANTNLSGDILIPQKHNLIQQPHHQQQQKSRRLCLGCSEKEATTAFVPCGHNTFCIDCSKRIYNRADVSDINLTCPICSLHNYQSLQIAA